MIDIIIALAVITLAVTSTLATKAHTILNNRINLLNDEVRQLRLRLFELEDALDDNEVHDGVPNDH